MYIWQGYTLGSMVLPNRFVRTAAGEGMCDDEGNAGQSLIEYYKDISRVGGLGAIITGHAFVSVNGRMRPGQIGIDHDSRISGLRRLAQAIRSSGTCAIVQLSHSGVAGTVNPAGPSVCAEHPEARAMSCADIHNVVHEFAHAAQRACEAGFDGVELHAAHGFFLSQFLSPFFNQRTDMYGGSSENRVRIVREIILAIRRACGIDFSIGIKVNATDMIPGGLTVEQAVEQLQELGQEKPDFVEVSGGLCTHPSPAYSPMQRIHNEHCYFADYARTIRRNVDIPVLMVGGIRTRETAENIVQNGWADLVGLCRPLLCEPDLLQRWKLGEATISSCRSCNGCVTTSRTPPGLRCVMAK